MAALMRFLSLLYLCVILSYDAQAGGCVRNTPKTYLYSDITQIEYVRTHHAQDLTELHQSDSTVLGLAGGPVGTKFEVIFEATPYQDKLYCLNVKKVEATFFANPTVYIARNFGRGSCEYNAVLRHELKHVNELKKTFHEYTPHYQRHLYQVAQDLPEIAPVTLDNINIIKQEIVENIESNMSKFQSDIMFELAKRQQEVDSQREYQRVQNVCHRWDKKLDGK